MESNGAPGHKGLELEITYSQALQRRSRLRGNRGHTELLHYSTQVACRTRWRRYTYFTATSVRLSVASCAVGTAGVVVGSQRSSSIANGAPRSINWMRT